MKRQFLGGTQRGRGFRSQGRGDFSTILGWPREDVHPGGMQDSDASIVGTISDIDGIPFNGELEQGHGRRDVSGPERGDVDDVSVDDSG